MSVFGFGSHGFCTPSVSFGIAPLSQASAVSYGFIPPFPILHQRLPAPPWGSLGMRQSGSHAVGQSSHQAVRQSPACQPARSPACLLACLPACPLARSPACLLARLPACLLACLPARLLARSPAWLLACLPVRMHLSVTARSALPNVSTMKHSHHISSLLTPHSSLGHPSSRSLPASLYNRNL